jgi:hypothetical protein
LVLKPHIKTWQNLVFFFFFFFFGETRRTRIHVPNEGTTGAVGGQQTREGDVSRTGGPTGGGAGSRAFTAISVNKRGGSKGRRAEAAGLPVAEVLGLGAEEAVEVREAEGASVPRVRGGEEVVGRRGVRRLREQQSELLP